MKSLLQVLVVLVLAITATEAGFSFPTLTGRSSSTSRTSATSATSGTSGGTPSPSTTGTASNSGLSALIANINANAEGTSLPYINNIRATVTPAPDTPLVPLVWDSNLANGANRWASKCFVQDHSDDYYAGIVGETYFANPVSSTANINFLTGITSWASQNVTFSLSDNSCFPGLDCSQFRQLAWAKTKKVGCAVNLCGGTLLAVCQYSPPGDFDGIVPYVSSAPVETVTKLDLASGATSVAPIGEQRKRGASCSANGQTGQCTAKNSCTAANGATAAYSGGGLCGQYLLSSTVCCIFGNSPSPTSAPVTSAPTVRPTNAPSTAAPTVRPTNTPSGQPTNAPATQQPTNAPATAAPTQQPTSAPGQKLTFPSSKDWRDATGAVSPVKNQQQCGSCWAFASTAVAESQVGIFTGGNVADISEQQVLSCSNSRSTCNGGYPPDALNYAINTGLIVDSRDKYTASDAACGYSAPSDYSFQKTGTVASNKDAILSALNTYGPILVTVYADDAWQKYRGGVLSNSTYTTTNHAVTLVGYDGGADAWIIKNSWGTSWGEKGFIRIAATGDYAMTKSRSYYLQKTQ